MEHLLEAGKSKRERGKPGWGLEKGERLRHNEQRDWAWKMIWVREVGSGSQAGTEVTEVETVSRRLCDVPLLATSVAFDLQSFAGSVSVYSQWHS